MFRYLCVLALAAIALPGRAEDWPQFRGPGFSGTYAGSKPLPTTWSETENVLWKTPLPARGISSPVVVDDRIYLTANSGFRLENLFVLCLDRKTGKLLWQRQMTATGNTGCHEKTNMSAPTPVADANGVYALFASGDLAAFERDGTLRWYRSLVGDYPTIGNQVGMSSSPVLANNTLIIPMDNSGESFIAGIDPRYGHNLWKTDRPKDVNWSTPLVVTGKAGTQVLMPGNRELVSYNPDNGKDLWHLPTGRGSSASPTPAGDKILFNSDGITAVKPEAGGKPQELWKTLKLSSNYVSPVYFDNRVYNVTGSNVLVCADAQTGKEIWQERVKSKGVFWASPIVGDGKLYLFNDLGAGYVFKLGDKPELLATNDLKEEIMGTPAPVNGCLYIRTDKNMYCIGAK